MVGTRVVGLALTLAAVLLAAPNQPTADDSSCEAIDRFALSRLKLPAGSLQDLKTQVQFPCSLPKNVDLNFLIATVPNPIETHLALWFDRAVESIINAAGSVGFRFQEAWLPWKADLVREESDIFKRNEMEAELKRREKEPGVLLFRNSVPCSMTTAQECQYSDLVVLLVPETPTGGIDPDVFADATKMIFSASSFLNGAGGASLAATPKIPVMGPSFSGSFPSLGKIMQQHHEIKLQVISGTAGSFEAWKQAFDENSESLYSTTVHNLATEFHMLVKHMSGSRIALLAETETALGWFYTEPVYGTAKFGSEYGPVIFRYPREISRLRNAYGDEVLKTVVGAQPQPPSFRNLLGFRLFDVGPGTDSAPVFAKNQTPLSQDAVLGEIARSLERERVTLAGILATDVFDALFIARYLRDACPDVRLFTFDSDLLYERAAEDFPFDGTLTLSTYPSITPNPGWTNERPERFSFPSRASEGIYNATRALLISANFVSTDYKSKPLAEYFNPAVSCARPGDSSNPTGSYAPPVWLTVVGRNGYWPLAVMNAPPEATQTGPDTPKHGRLLAWPSDNHPHLDLGPLPRLWQLTFVSIALALCWHLVRTFMACATGYGRLRWFSSLHVWPDEEGWLARLCYLLVCSSALFALYVLFVAPLISISWQGRAADARWYVWFAYLLLFVFLVLGASPLLAFRKRKPAKLIWPEKWHYGILCLAAMLAGFFTWDLARLFPLDPKARENEEAFFFAFRSLHLNSGVSPVVPLLVLLLAYFVWARVHLHRVETINEQLIDVPPLADSSRCDGAEVRALVKCRHAIDRLMNQPLPLRWWRTGGALVLVLATHHYMTHPLRSFEYEPFDELFLVMLSVLYALIFLTWTRFLLAWHQFHLFLEQLERHSLRFAFAELPRRRAISPLFQFTAWHAEFTLVAIRERLAELKLKRPAPVDLASLNLTDKLDCEIGQILASAAMGLRISRKEAAPLRQWLKQVNDALLQELNRGVWKSRRPARSADQPEVAPSPDILREEVIALQYDDYIQYILHQQRNLLLFAVLGFILSILALHVYPFEGPRTITTFITFVFIAFAGTVIVVLTQAERNFILSQIMKTTPGKLSGGFFLRVAGYIGVPLITVLASQFPSLGHFLFSWIQPLLDAFK